LDKSQKHFIGTISAKKIKTSRNKAFFGQKLDCPKEKTALPKHFFDTSSPIFSKNPCFSAPKVSNMKTERSKYQKELAAGVELLFIKPI